MRILTILLMAMFTSAAAAVQLDHRQFGSARELILPDFQYEKLRLDLPVTSAVLDKGNSLWISGQRSIWRWQLTTNQLQRVELLRDLSGGALREVIMHQDSLFAMTDRDLYQIKFNPLAVVRLKSRQPDIKSISLAAGGKHLYWTTTKGIYAANLSEKTLIPLTDMPKLETNDNALFIWETDSVWYLRDNNLYLQKIKSEDGIPKKILSSKQKIRAIQRGGDGDVFVHTRFSVLRYDLNGNLIQTIPVAGARKLVLMSPSPGAHAYLFSDKLLEVFQLDSKKSLNFRLEIGRVQQASKILINGSMVSLILDGKPRAFQLSGSW